MTPVPHTREQRSGNISLPCPPTLPNTREQALTLLQAAEWNPYLLSPEEREAIRHLYALDDDRTISERLHEQVPLPRGARYIHPRQSRQEAE